MTTAQVVKGQRYAIGVAVPLVARLTGPLAGLREATEETGFHALNADGEAALYLAANGWTNAIVYRTGQAPIVEPPGVQDYVLIATRSGDTASVNTDDPAFAGAVLWIIPAATVAPPGVPSSGGSPLGGGSSSSSSGSSAEQSNPWPWLVVAAILVVGTVAIVASSGDD